MTAETASHHGVEPTDDAAQKASHEPVEEEILVEEISIDGMCGVY